MFSKIIMVILKENYKGDLYMKANKIILPIIIFFNSLVMMDNTNKKPKALEILQGPMFNNIIIPNLTKKMNNPARPANEKKKNRRIAYEIQITSEWAEYNYYLYKRIERINGKRINNEYWLI